MTEFERQVLEKLTALESAVNSLRSEFTIAQLTYFENLPAHAVVGTDYVSYRFGCSQDAVVRGRFETDKIPRLRSKPIAFIKRNVDAVWMNLNKPVKEEAAEIRYKTDKRRKNK
jgi:hypothetical protein